MTMQLTAVFEEVGLKTTLQECRHVVFAVFLGMVTETQRLHDNFLLMPPLHNGLRAAIQ